MSNLTDRKKEFANQLSALRADRYQVIITPSIALQTQSKPKTAYTFTIPNNVGNRAKGYTAAELLDDRVLAMLAAKNVSGYSIGIKCKSQRYHYASLYDASLEDLQKLKANGVESCLVSVVRRNVQKEEFFSVVIRFEKTDELGDLLYASKVSGSYQVYHGEKTWKSLESIIPMCGFKDQISGMFVCANRFADRNCPTSKERYQTFAKTGSASYTPIVVSEKPVNIADDEYYFQLSREFIIANASKAMDKIEPNEIDGRLRNQLLKEGYDLVKILEFLTNRLKPKVLESIDF